MTVDRDLPRGGTPVRAVSSRSQLLVAGAAGVVVGVATGVGTESALGILVGWDVAALVYVVRAWRRLWPMDAEETSAAAVAVDPTRAMSDLVLIGASMASLVAVGFVLRTAASEHGGAQELRIGLGLLSVVVSWCVVHAVYTLRYALLYYAGEDGGIGFNEDEPPDFADFAYVSLTIGMTFQVSDTDLKDKHVRRTAVKHALLSYVFGAGVVATTVNLVASLTTK